MPKHAKKQEGNAKYEPVIKPPAEYADCNGYMNPPGACKILTEMFCVARGTCKFYKSKEKRK